MAETVAADPGSRRLALVVACVNLALVVYLLTLSCIWPSAGLAWSNAAMSGRLAVILSQLLPLLAIAWCVVLLAIAIPLRDAHRWRWTIYASLAALWLAEGWREGWSLRQVATEPVGSPLPGPDNVATGVSSWLALAQPVVWLGFIMAATLLVTAVVRRSGPVTDGAAPEAHGSSGVARTWAASASAGAAVVLIGGLVRSRFWRDFAFQNLARDLAGSLTVGGLLLVLLFVGWLAVPLTLSFTGSRYPRAAWAAFGAAGLYLFLSRLSGVIVDIRGLGQIGSVKLAGSRPLEPYYKAVLREHLVESLIVAGVPAFFGAALAAAAVLQYRAWQAPGQVAAPTVHGVAPVRRESGGWAPWRVAAATAAALAAVTLLAPALIPPLGEGGARPADRTVMMEISPSPSAAPAGVRVSISPAPGDGIPAVVRVDPAADGTAAEWSGTSVQVFLLRDGEETIDPWQCRFWLDGTLVDDAGIEIELPTSRMPILVISWQPPAQGDSHTFRVRIAASTGKRLECSWIWRAP